MPRLGINGRLNIVKKAAKYALVFMILIAAYVLLLTAAYSIPESLVEENRQLAFERIDSGVYSVPFYEKDNSTLDDISDRAMFKDSIALPEYNALENAMWNNSYPRYWNGQQIFLRPLMVVATYPQMLSWLPIVYGLLFFSTFYVICKKFNFWFGIAFAGAILLVKGLLVPYCIHYALTFFVMFIVCILVIKKYKPQKNFSMFFFIVGSMTVFFDFINIPAVTVAVPLILIVSMMNKDEAVPIKKSVTTILKYSFIWFFGYVFTWLAKFVLGNLFLNKDIVAYGMKSVVYRLTESEGFVSSRLVAIGKNICGLFGIDTQRFIDLYNEHWTNGRTIVLLAVLAVIFVAIVAFLIVKRDKLSDTQKRIVPLLLIACYPYVWYAVMSNHSIIHFWFTYRLQLISIFALSLVIVELSMNRRSKSLLKNQEQ